MNWSDERYVKLYTRDTLTWLSLSFEARAVLALMLRKVNGAGIMETGTLDPARAVAMQIVAPVDVVAKALPELIAIETIEMVPNGVALTNFVAAQEATKTEARKKRDQRQNDLDQRRQAQLVESLRTTVPARPELSRAVPLQPSPAQPTTTTSSPPTQPTTSPAKAKPKKPKAQPELPTLEKPTPPRAPGVVERLHGFFTELRQEKCEDLGLGETPPPDEPPNWPRSGATIATWVSLRSNPEAGEVLGRLIISAFIDDPYWAGATNRETGAPQPYPWNALLSEKVWKRLVEQIDRETDAAPEAGAA